MRLFFALWPNAAFRDYFAELLTPEPFAWKGKKIVANNLHLTLVFLGQVDALRLEQVIEVAEAVKSERFELVFDHLGYWKKPQVVWAGVNNVSSSLTGLVTNLWEGLSAIGFIPEEREYSPHLTLIRKVVKRPRLPEIKACSWLVDDFCLVQSQRSSEGSNYQIIKSWSLADNKTG